MEGLGKRLKHRAREIGISDAEAARRAGLSPTRYGHYVSDYREPDLSTLVRICEVLGTSADSVLGMRDEEGQSDLEQHRIAIAGYSRTMSLDMLKIAVVMMRALVVSEAATEHTDNARQERELRRT